MWWVAEGGQAEQGAKQQVGGNGGVPRLSGQVERLHAHSSSPTHPSTCRQTSTPQRATPSPHLQAMQVGPYLGHPTTNKQANTANKCTKAHPCTQPPHLQAMQVGDRLDELARELLDQVDGKGPVLVLAHEVEQAGPQLLKDLGGGGGDVQRHVRRGVDGKGARHMAHMAWSRGGSRGGGLPSLHSLTF